jgi:hypothetical protein
VLGGASLELGALKTNESRFPSSALKFDEDTKKTCECVSNSFKDHQHIHKNSFSTPTTSLFRVLASFYRWPHLLPSAPPPFHQPKPQFDKRILCFLRYATINYSFLPRIFFFPPTWRERRSAGNHEKVLELWRNSRQAQKN